MPTDGTVYRFCTIRDVLYLAARDENVRVGWVKRPLGSGGMGPITWTRYSIMANNKSGSSVDWRCWADPLSVVPNGVSE